MTAETLPGILLCDDLMFSSRITGVARQLGLVIKTARSLANFEALLLEQAPALVLVDLGHPDLAIADLIKKIRPEGKTPFLVAYGSHVDAAGLKKARDAGCDLVLPRSKFVEDLPRALPGWFTGKP